jgi:putative thiamine transport system permease protein
MRNNLLAAPLVLLFVAPLVLSLALILPGFTDVAGFQAFLQHPQIWGAARLTVAISVCSTLLALICAVLIVTGNHKKLLTKTSSFLALPHLALAIGLGFLIAPTGLIARILGTVFGWNSPPQWVTVQDPHGAGLIAALVLKETPFLVWALISLLNRDDLKQLLAGHMKVARSLGHSEVSAWIAVLLPQLLPRITLPLIAVFVYGATVVDMALVIGPTQPPVLASVIWNDINDSDPFNNSRGAAGVLILTLLIVVMLALVKVLQHFATPFTKKLLLGVRGKVWKTSALSTFTWSIWRCIYTFILLFLVVASLSGHFPYPNLLPVTFNPKAWSLLVSDPRPFLTSTLLATTTSLMATAAVIAWLESQNASRDRVMLIASVAALCIPSLLIALGQYRTFLAIGITGTATALFFAHILPVSAYVFVMLHGPYRGYDKRWQSTTQGLLASRLRFLVQIKWPMLKAPILSASAVGFAVSVAQYVPAQLAAAGRFTTLPMEAVTLTSGGNRALIATYALALMLLPLFAFLAASRFAKPRWKARDA